MDLKEIISVNPGLHKPICASIVSEYLRRNDILELVVSDDLCPDASIRSYVPDIQKYVEHETGYLISEEEVIMVWLVDALKRCEELRAN